MKSGTLIAALATGLLYIAGCNFGEPTVGIGGGTGVEGISGRIVAPGGAPAAGATVKVYPVASSGTAKRAAAKPGTHAFPAADSATLTASGTFSFPNLAAGTYNVVALTRRGDTAFALLLRGIIVTNKGQDLGTDTLKVAGSVVFQVGSEGEPVAGAHCYVPSTPFEAVSDSLGRCTLSNLPPGTFDITVSHPQYQVGVSGDVSVLPGLLNAGGLLDLVNTVAGPAAPVLLSPADGASADSEALLSWAAVSGATRYHLQVAANTDPTFASPLRSDTGLGVLSAAVNLKSAGVAYRWRVRAGNAARYGAWSAVRTFVTGSATATSHFAVTASTTALWRFDSTDQAGRIPDLGPSGIHLSATSAVPLETSPQGKAAVFIADGKRYSATGTSVLSPAATGKLTVETRVFLPAYPRAGTMNSSSEIIGTYPGPRLLITGDGGINISMQMRQGDTNLWYSPKSEPGVVPLNRWFTLAYAIDATVNPVQVYAYIDGNPVRLHESPVSQLAIAASGNLTVGNDPVDNLTFNGKIDEIRISNQLVHASRIPLAPVLLGVSTATRDALLWGSAPGVTAGANADRNGGTVDRLEVGVYDRNTVARSLVAFTVPPGVRGADIGRAVIRITSHAWITRLVSPDSVELRAHRVLKSWKEGAGAGFDGTPNSALVDGATALRRYWGTDGSERWNAMLVGLDDVDASVAPAGRAVRARGHLGTWELDVTALVKTWADSPATNHGVLLAGDIPATNPETRDYPQFHAREAAVADSLKPTLIIYGP